MAPNSGPGFAGRIAEPFYDPPFPVGLSNVTGCLIYRDLPLTRRLRFENWLRRLLRREERLSEPIAWIEPPAHI